MAKKLNSQKGTTNPNVPMPVITEVESYDVTKGPVGPKKTVRRGSGAQTKAKFANGPMA